MVKSRPSGLHWRVKITPHDCVKRERVTRSHPSDHESAF